MSVAYLLPSNREEAMHRQVVNLQDLMRHGDTVCVSNAAGMMNALRQCMAEAETEIVRNCADDDYYNLPGSTRAVEVMEADPSLDVLVTGGIRTNANAICVPKGEDYGFCVESVAWYGACGSGLFMRSEAVRKYSLFNYDGRLIDNFIVLKAIASGAKVKFCRLDTYRHHMSIADMTPERYAEFHREKKALRSAFGIWGVARRSHEAPPNWDGAFS